MHLLFSEKWTFFWLNHEETSFWCALVDNLVVCRMSSIFFEILFIFYPFLFSGFDDLYCTSCTFPFLRREEVKRGVN